jgi:hypothetical protein
LTKADKIEILGRNSLQPADPTMPLANEVPLHPSTALDVEEWDALAASLANLGLGRLQISSDSGIDEPREGESQGNAALEECREVDRRIGTSAQRQDRKRSRSRRSRKRNGDPGKKRKERHTPEAQKRLFV